MNKSISQIAKQNIHNRQLKDNFDPNFDPMKIFYQDPVSTLGAWIDVTDEANDDEAGDDILRKDFWYREGATEEVDEDELFEEMDDIIEGKVDYDAKKEFPAIAGKALISLRNNMLKPEQQRIDECLGQAMMVATIETLYKNYIEELEKEDNKEK